MLPTVCFAYAMATAACCPTALCLSLRELIHWRGEPDPFKGDVPNARVREFAKEVVEVMFNTTPIQNTNNTLAAQVRPQQQHGRPTSSCSCMAREARVHADS